MFYRRFLQPVLFAFAPETAHGLTVSMLKALCRLPGALPLLHNYFHIRDPRLRRRVMGLEFPNPVGLAAGFDKDGKVFREMAALGFGFVELGTVTPLPQPGNPKPRLFRLPADQALINRMGFNNLGATALAKRLSRTPRPDGLILGGNIGKNKNTPNDQASADYLACFSALFPWVDYFVVNVSSPNTPDLRELQDKARLAEILHTLQAQNAQYPSPKPILLKIAPDLNIPQLDDILQIVRQTKIAGIVATNTTVSRKDLATPAAIVHDIGPGGLSGTPLRQMSTEIIRYLRAKGPTDMVIIGAGGIGNAREAMEKLAAGADLLQIYTGLVYCGPGLPKSIHKSLLA
jgi:dihydroorotate dehydrogenase